MFHKLKLIWLCGRINEKIGKARDKGKDYVEIYYRKKRVVDEFVPSIMMLYRKQGYKVFFPSRYSDVFIVSWKKPNRVKNISYSEGEN